MLPQLKQEDVQGQIELRDLLLGRLAQLRPKYRTALVLRYFEDQSFAQIADIMDCAEPTARSFVHRALRALRLLVKDELDD